MGQSDQYGDKEEVAYVANFPGADIEDDVVVVRVGGGELDIGDDEERKLGSVDIEDRDGRVLGDVEISSVKEAIETTLHDALSSEGEDSVLVSTDEALDVSGEVVEVKQASAFEMVALKPIPINSESPLDVSAAEVDVDIASQSQSPITVTDDGSLAISVWDAGTVPTEQQSPIGIEGDVQVVSSQPLDVSGEVVEVSPTNTGEAYFSSVNMEADGSVSRAMQAVGGSSLNGQVVSDSQYTVEVAWDDDQGNTVRTEEVAAGVAGGTWTNINLDLRSPRLEVVVSDGSSSQSTVSGTLHIGT